MRALWLAGMVVFASASLAAQGVMVAPHAVFIDHSRGSGSVLLYNPGTEPVEVSISTIFGYPTTDSSGNIKLNTIENPDSTVPSALAWVQAFPRRLTVAPKERQTVRLLARPPVGLADGEYWLRLVIAAQAGTVPITGVSDTTAIQVGLKLEVRTIIGVNYRKGAVMTGVALSNLRAQVVGDSVITRARLERRGNAAFIGMIRETIVDSTGAVRAQRIGDSLITTYQSPIGVYFTMEPRLASAIPVPGLARGRYWLRYEVVAEREDLDPKVVLKAPAVRDSVRLVVP
jgi:P pilus assembly chaperone PapD